MYVKPLPGKELQHALAGVDVLRLGVVSGYVDAGGFLNSKLECSYRVVNGGDFVERDVSKALIAGFVSCAFYMAEIRSG